MYLRSESALSAQPTRGGGAEAQQVTAAWLGGRRKRSDLGSPEFPGERRSRKRGWGRAADLPPVAQAMLDAYLIPPRFAIWERRGNNERTGRIGDDLEASHVNGLAGSVDKSIR